MGIDSGNGINLYEDGNQTKNVEEIKPVEKQKEVIKNLKDSDSKENIEDWEEKEIELKENLEEIEDEELDEKETEEEFQGVGFGGISVIFWLLIVLVMVAVLSIVVNNVLS